MRRTKRILRGLLFLVCVLPASSYADDSGTHPNIHKIAVVSIIGNEVDMQTLGPAFSAKAYKLQTDWNIDEKIAAEIARLLAGRFMVSTAVDSRAFGTIENGIFDNPVSEVQRRIAALPKVGGLDAYIVVFPFQLNGSANWSGLFVRRDPGLFGGGTTIVGVYYYFGVFDASTGKRIDYGTPKLPAAGFLSGFSPPSATCSKTMWADTAEGLSDEQKSGIRREMLSLATKSVGYAMAGANLITKSEADANAKLHAGDDDPSCQLG